jgi:hypothetical protein
MKQGNDTSRTVHHNEERRHSQWRARLAITLVLSLLADYAAPGYAGPATTPFSPSLDPADAVQLDAGYHQISPYFGYDVRGGFFSGRRITIYRVADPLKAGKKEPLAVMGIGYLGNLYYRPAVFAVSSDGQTLLYRHEKSDSARGSLKSKPSGLYEYTHGSGERLVHLDIGVVEAEPLPRDAFIFSENTYKGDLWVGGEAYIRTTSGDEYPAIIQGGNALHRAAYLGETEQVLDLLRSGVAVEATDARGFTPLLEAIWAGQLGAVKALLDHGADLNVTVPDLAWTPLDEAARFGHNDIVDVLIDKGMDVNARNALGKSPYDLALEYQKPETAAHLVERGAQVTASRQ